MISSVLDFTFWLQELAMFMLYLNEALDFFNLLLLAVLMLTFSGLKKELNFIEHTSKLGWNWKE